MESAMSNHWLSRTTEYQAWIGMKSRCYNPNCNKYHAYGQRGITICEKWKNSFDSFLFDMGEKPTAKHSIDRTNNDGDYEPSNCRWATAEQQSRNQRLQKNNKTGVKGVGFHKRAKKWAVMIGANNKSIHLGYFEHFDDARRAREDAELKYWS